MGVRVGMAQWTSSKLKLSSETYSTWYIEDSALSAHHTFGIETWTYVAADGAKHDQVTT